MSLHARMALKYGERESPMELHSFLCALATATLGTRDPRKLVAPPTFLRFPHLGCIARPLVGIGTLCLLGRDADKITLGSFLFRDDCCTLLTRLVNVSSSISRLNGGLPDASTGALSPAAEDNGASVVVDAEPRPRDAPPEPSESSPGVAIPRALSSASYPGDGKFETMLETVLPGTTAQVRFFQRRIILLLA